MNKKIVLGILVIVATVLVLQMMTEKTAPLAGSAVAATCPNPVKGEVCVPIGSLPYPPPGGEPPTTTTEITITVCVLATNYCSAKNPPPLPNSCTSALAGLIGKSVSVPGAPTCFTCGGPIGATTGTITGAAGSPTRQLAGTSCLILQKVTVTIAMTPDEYTQALNDLKNARCAEAKKAIADAGAAKFSNELSNECGKFSTNDRICALDVSVPIADCGDPSGNCEEKNGMMCRPVCGGCKWEEKKVSTGSD